ncbi:hypothetical protein ACQ4PT_060585 [Festuca glaucescens]
MRGCLRFSFPSSPISPAAAPFPNSHPHLEETERSRRRGKQQLDMHGKRDRRIGDGCPPGFTVKSRRQDICFLLDHIHGFYKAALDRLPIPSLAPRLLEAGMCIGFLDPVSNIIANTIAYNPSPAPSSTPLRRSDEEETRESILSQIITDTNDKFVFQVPLSRHKAGGMTIARRSLDGLVAFLTSHYRYLADSEALRYLSLAKADLLVAVRLIERDRNKKRNDELAFSTASRATKVALECAAVSAGHPKPGVLVTASVIMASPQADRTVLLAGQDPSLAEFLREGHMSMDRSLDLCGKEKNKKKRKKRDQTSTPTESIEGITAHNNRLGSQTTFRYTQSLKLLLLGKIHGLYLQALAKLPRDGLHKFHHSLLKCGYCYGPRDPVSNIILNTIWYGSTFPTPPEFELQFKVDMILTDMLARIECCSALWPSSAPASPLSRSTMLSGICSAAMLMSARPSARRKSMAMLKRCVGTVTSRMPTGKLRSLHGTPTPTRW